MNKTNQVLSFLHVVENLKNELRHSWTSKNRKESVSEHSWRTALMVIVCFQISQRTFDLQKALMMALVHALGEAIVGDEHYFDIHRDEKTQKCRLDLEREAISELTTALGEAGKLIFSLWKEFADKKTYEAIVVDALDKLEVCIQHNEADISTWSQREIDGIFSYLADIDDTNDFILKLKADVIEETTRKLAGK